MSEPSSASISRPATLTSSASSPTSSPVREETKSASSIEPAPPAKGPEGAGVELPVEQLLATVMPFGQRGPAACALGASVQLLAKVIPFGQRAPPELLPIMAARNSGPNPPSGINPLCDCQAITEALVKGPKAPSAVAPTKVCKHFTSSPTEPTLKVEVIEQSAEAVFAKKATPPTTKTATSITPRRNFDFNKLLINFFLTFLRH